MARPLTGGLLFSLPFLSFFSDLVYFVNAKWALITLPKTGFHVQHREGGFAIVTCDEITVHFTHHPEIPPEENNSVCRIVVSNIEALYQEILSIKALHPHLFSRTPNLATQPWGEKEINLVDPCGILLRFSEPISQADAGSETGG